MLGETMNDEDEGDRKSHVQAIQTEEAADSESGMSEERRGALLQDAAEFYHGKLLNAKEGHPGEGYLTSKKFGRETLVKHKVGLAENDGLKGYLLNKGYTVEEGLSCGVFVKYSGKEAVDAFRHALIFPVVAKGKVVSLIARGLREGDPKYRNLRGTIEWLYNEDVLADAKKVIIAEGISDAITLIQHGYPAVGALGAGLFKQEFKDKFHNVKMKHVCFDNDDAGRKGMEAVDRIFDGDSRIIALPEGIKDISDYFQSHDKEEFNLLVARAKRFVNYALDQVPEKKIHLVDIESAENIEKRAQVVFRIAGVGSTYFVPVRFKVRYKVDGEPARMQWFTIPQNSVLLLKMCNESAEAQWKDLRRFAETCLGPSATIEKLKIEERISITQLIVQPKIKELKMKAGAIITEEGKEFRQKAVYFQGVKNTTTSAFNASGYVLADPRTSEARFLVSDYKEIKEDFDKFKLTSEVKKLFDSFMCKDLDGIDEHLDRLAESAAYTFVRIYGELRKDAIIASLLCFHSPLYFNFENENVPGWLQIILLGDTTTGKSKIPGRIREYVDVGALVTGETCTRTGFLYCIDTKTLSSSILTWGRLPQQDRSILIIDGANYIKPEEWGMAREARRTGKLLVERAAKGEHPCRTRLVLMANPTRSLNQYIYPIEALKDVHQDPDIARTDLCICFATSDVPKEEINVPQEERLKPEMNIDQETLQQSIFWSFSRKIDDIEISETVTKTINEVANRLLDKFGSASDIPLISNDVKYKVVRLSVALACLLHSTNKGHEKVIVTKEVVEAIERLICRIYSAPNCRFDQYAANRKLVTDITSDEIMAIKRAIEDEAKKDRSNILTEMIGLLRANSIIRLNEIAARLDRSDSTIKSKLVFFKRFGLIRSGKSGYAKTEKFVQFLNKLEQEKKASPS